MRGISIQKGTEVRIQVEGENWKQGATVSGQVEVRNSKTPSTLRVILAHARDKKVKEKSSDAFDVVDTKTFESVGSTQTFEFALPLNAKITDKSSSLYVLYGLNDGLSDLGLLKLTVHPHQHIQDAIEAISITHRFVLKSLNATKECKAEACFIPPSAKEFVLVKEANASFEVTQTELLLDLEMVVDEIDTVSAGLKMKKVKKNFSRAFPLKELLHSFNQRVNKEVIEIAWEELINESKAGNTLLK